MAFMASCLRVFDKHKTLMNNTSKLVVFLLAGAAIGAAASLLLAPAKGEESRDHISDWFNGLVDTVKDTAKQQIDSLVDAGKQVMGKGKAEMESSTAYAKDAVQAS